MKRELIERKCILEGVVKPTSELLRFVMIDNTIIPDFSKKLPGKGIYVTNNRHSLQKALDKKLFQKVSRHCVRVDDNFMDVVTKILKQKALNSLSLAKKSGALISGFEKVKEAIKKNNVEFVIEASDAAEDGKEKIVLLAKSIEIFNLFSIDELDRTLNKDNTVHLAVLKNKIAQMVYQDLKKYQNFVNDGENN